MKGFTWNSKAVLQFFQKNRWTALLLLVGLALLLWPTGGTGDNSTPAATEQRQQYEYDLESLEEKLADTLSQVDGAGKTQVVLTLATTGSVELAENQTSKDGSVETQVVVVKKGSNQEDVVEVAQQYPAFLGALASQASEQVDAVLHSAFRSAGFMLLVVLFCGTGNTLFQSGQSAMTRTADLIGVTVITLVAVSDTASMLGLGREAIGQIDAFSKVLIPTMATATAACGSVTGAVARQAATLLFSDLLITLINRVLIPVVYLYIAVTAATAALGSKGIAAIAGFMKKGVKGAMTAILLVFTGYLTLSGAAAGAADATALKATRMAISSMVPVVGGILSDATETVLTGASAIRSGIGIFGTLVILGFCVVPFLYLGVQYLVYKLVAMLASVLYQGTISDLIDQIGAAFGLVLGMLGSCALLVLISLIGTISVAMT